MIDLSIRNNIYNDDDLEEALQELDILFNTENTELLGDINIGINMQPYLWTLTPSTDSLKQYLNSKLMNLTYLQKFQYNLNVKHYNDDIGSMYHVIIDIYINENRKIKKEYKFK